MFYKNNEPPVIVEWSSEDFMTEFYARRVRLYFKRIEIYANYLISHKGYSVIEAQNWMAHMIRDGEWDIDCIDLINVIEEL